MTRWCNRHTLTVILLIVGAGTLQGCVHDSSGRYPAYGDHGYFAPATERGGEGSGSEGGGGMR